MARDIRQTITIEESPEDVFDALITPSMIKKWWSVTSAIVMPEPGGIYALTWGEDEDDPDYITTAILGEFVRPEKLRMADYQYRSKFGSFPFDAELETEFLLRDLGESTRLTVIQTGFPDDKAADGFYRDCIKGWDNTLAALKKTLEE